MIFILPMLILSAEMLLTYAFTRSLYPVLMVLTALYTTFGMRIKNKAAATTLTLTGLLAILILFSLSRPYFSLPVNILLIVQTLQVLIYGFGMLPFSSSNWYTTHLRAAMSAPLLTLGFVAVYIAFGDHPAIHPLFSYSIGTTLLILLVMEIENCFAPHARGTIVAQSGISPFRLGMILLTLALTVSLSGLAVAPLSDLSIRLSDWVQSIHTGRKGGPAAPPQPNAAQKKTTYSGPPGRYILRQALELEDHYNRQVPHIPELHVVVHSAKPERHPLDQRLYIRCGSLDTFSGTTWSNRYEESEIIMDEDDGFLDGAIVLNNQVRNPITYTVALRSATSLLMPSIPTAAIIEQRAVGRKTGDVFFSPVPLDFVKYYAYSMTSSDVRWDDLPRGLHEPGSAPEQFTWLADTDLTQKIRNYAAGAIGDAASGWLKVERLRRRLQTDCSYSLEMKNESGLHPIDNFLFHEKQGHCEMFASSFVIMLRSIGIPSRLAFGYVGGEYDDSQKLYTFYRDHGHAWVEIYLKRFGWMTFDPTPPSPYVPAAPVKIQRSELFNMNDYPAMAALVNSRFPADESVSGGSTAGWLRHLLRRPWLLVDAVLIVIAVVFIIVIRTAGPRFERKPLRKKSKSRTPAYFSQFCRHFAHLGCKKAPNQTAREYLSELEHRGLSTSRHAELISYFEQTTYGPHKRSQTKEDEFRKSLSKSYKEPNPRE